MKIFLLLFLLVIHVPAQADGGCTSKLQGFVSRSGYKVREAKPCKVWLASDALAIPKEGGMQGMLLIAQEGSMGMLGAVVQVKARLDLSSDLLKRLLQLNNELEYAKVGIDHDGDLFVRTELRMDTLTEADFKATVKNLNEAASKVWAALNK